MEMTLRWYGTGYDSVTLEQIRQIPGVRGVITTLYDTPVSYTHLDVYKRQHRDSAEADLEKHEEQHADDQAAGFPALSQRSDDAQGDQRLPQLAEAVQHRAERRAQQGLSLIHILDDVDLPVFHRFLQ